MYRYVYMYIYIYVYVYIYIYIYICTYIFVEQWQWQRALESCQKWKPQTSLTGNVISCKITVVTFLHKQVSFKLTHWLAPGANPVTCQHLSTWPKVVFYG